MYVKRIIWNRVVSFLDARINSRIYNEGQDDYDYDPDFNPDLEPEVNSVNENRMKLPTLERAVQRNFIPDRPAAELTTSAILDFVKHHNIHGYTWMFLIIVKNKIRRKVNKLIKMLKF